MGTALLPFLFLFFSMPGTARGELLAVRFNASGVLETIAPDTAEEGSRNFEPGSPLVCRWRLPDVDAVQWTLKDRGIVYTRAYRRCWPTGGVERVRSLSYTPDGPYILADSGNAGLLVTHPRGTSRSVPSPGQYDDGPGEEGREAFAVEGRPGFFVLYTHHQKSILSRLLDRWQSDIYWFPDPENLETHQLILSRTADRVQSVTSLSRRDLRIRNALRGSETDSGAPSGSGPSQSTGESEEEVKRRELKEKWPWLMRADRVREALFQVTRPQDPSQQEDAQDASLYFLLNSKRFARLIPGSGEMVLFPEFEGGLFRDKILDFHVLDDNTVVILMPTALYTLDLASGTFRITASFPQASIKMVYPGLAVTPDHRYAGVMFWTRAHRNEIYIADLERGQKLKRLVRGEMDMRFVPGIDPSAIYNPNAFNFSPDGLSLVTLWNLKDGQEVRVYRLLDGDLGPLPPENEEAEDASPTVPLPVPDAEAD